jgi:hypothetical protein
MTSWTTLDRQMAGWSHRLTTEVRISEAESRILATKIAADTRFLPSEVKLRIVEASPIAVDARLDELRAFQQWMENFPRRPPAALVRAQVITQLYVCFVYLPEGCFTILAKSLPGGSVAKKCARFLTNDRIRQLRNAVAHANWRYLDDFSGIAYWARKGDHESPLSEFQVKQEELNFWQALSRTMAYAALSNLR